MLLRCTTCELIVIVRDSCSMVVVWHSPCTVAERVRHYVVVERMWHRLNLMVRDTLLGHHHFTGSSCNAIPSFC